MVLLATFLFVHVYFWRHKRRSAATFGHSDRLAHYLNNTVVTGRTPYRNAHTPSATMSSSSSNNSTNGVETSMIPWLHFTGGDHLLFKSLTPSSKGAIAGACIVLVVLALFERWVAARRGVLEARWRKRCVLASMILLPCSDQWLLPVHSQ